MGTTLSNLSPRPGARHTSKRLGRGPGSGKGTTAGKGQKGQKSRSGKDIGRGFEGGQMPLQRRLPKRGFKNLFRTDFAAVNVSQVAKVFEAGQVVDPEALKANGLMPRRAERCKILGNGQITAAVTVKAHAFSRSAREKIEAAGGTVEVVEVPRRKPASKSAAAEQA